MRLFRPVGVKELEVIASHYGDRFDGAIDPTSGLPASLVTPPPGRAD